VLEVHTVPELLGHVGIGPDVLGLQQVGGAVGPGGQVVVAEVAQAALEDPGDLPVLRVDEQMAGAP
jgi:hypothetical protein